MERIPRKGHPKETESFFMNVSFAGTGIRTTRSKSFSRRGGLCYVAQILNAASAKEQSERTDDLEAYVVSLNLRAVKAPATMAASARWARCSLPTHANYGVRGCSSTAKCEALKLAIVRRMACIEADRDALARAVHNALQAEYNYFVNPLP